MNGDTAPVSAFAAYRNQAPIEKPKKNNRKKRNRQKLNGAPPAKKLKKSPKKTHETLVQTAISPVPKKNKKVNGVAPTKKPPKPVYVIEDDDEDDDDEEPPTLVPIDDTSLKYIKKQKKLNKKKTKPTKEAVTSESSDQSGDEDNSTECLKLFSYLISPLEVETFLEKYWEKKSICISRQQPKYYQGIFSSHALDEILRKHPLHYGRNIDVVSYENGVKSVHNQEGRAVAPAVWNYYSNGCSIRVLNPQTYNAKVHLMLAVLQEYFGTMVGANVYLTPPGSQGFAPHYDDIEAFVVQLEGRKHWKLYKPRGSDVLARDSSANFNAETLGKPYEEKTLNAGDILYFPRGIIHEGRTDDDAHSLHITLSVYQHTAYADLLEHALPRALKKAATENINFRKGLPVNYLKHVGYVNKDADSSERDTVLNTVFSLMGQLADYVDVDDAADQLGRKFMREAMPPIPSMHEANHSAHNDGDFMKKGKIYDIAEFGLETQVRLLRYHCLRLVVEENGTGKIYYCTENARVYHGEDEQWLEVDDVLVPAIVFLQNSYPQYVDVEILPIEDVERKIQLVSDLWERGLIVTKYPLSRNDEFCDSDEDIIVDGTDSE